MTARAILAATAFLFVSALSNASAAQDRTSDSPFTATILCYHIIESPQDPRMEVSRETFHQQMRYLAMTGYTVIPLRDLYEYVTGKRQTIPKNAIVITFDDGWRSTYTEVFPDLQQRHFPFTVFIYPKIIGQSSHALNWKQVKEMVDAGVDVQSHALSHRFLSHRRHSALGDPEYQTWLQRELHDSKQILEKETGHAVSFLAYPYGDYDRHVMDTAVKAGYTAALTCEFGPVRRGSDPLKMRRVVVDKRMDFATFRHYLGNGSLKFEETIPPPGKTFDPGQVVISAKIQNFQTLDPKSVGIALLSFGSTPYSYDPRDGSVSLVVGGASAQLKDRDQRAVVWATDVKSGKRVEGSWTFRLPESLSSLPPSDLAPSPERPGGEPALPAVAATGAATAKTTREHDHEPAGLRAKAAVPRGPKR